MLRIESRRKICNQVTEGEVIWWGVPFVPMKVIHKEPTNMYKGTPRFYTLLIEFGPYNLRWYVRLLENHRVLVLASV